MPISQNTRASHQATHSTANALPTAGQHPALICSDIANNRQVDSREGIKAMLLQEARRVAGACPKLQEDCYRKGHNLCKPFLCQGLSTPADFGRWAQVVSYQPDEAHPNTDNDFGNSARHVVTTTELSFLLMNYHPTYTSMRKCKHFRNILKSSSLKVTDLSWSTLQTLDPVCPLLHFHHFSYLLPHLLQFCRCLRWKG